MAKKSVFRRALQRPALSRYTIICVPINYKLYIKYIRDRADLPSFEDSSRNNTLDTYTVLHRVISVLHKNVYLTFTILTRQSDTL